MDAIPDHRFKRKPDGTCAHCGNLRWHRAHVQPKHREPPPYPYQGPAKGYGWCVFCGEQVLPPSSPGGPLGPRERARPERCTWHSECAGIVQLARSSEIQRAAVFKRDHGICSTCGAGTQAVRIERYGRQLNWIDERGRDTYPPKRARLAREAGDLTGWYCPVRFVECWLFEVDHIVPLWRAPREWRYWGLENLTTACRACHAIKTAAEARERAEIRRGAQATGQLALFGT